MSKLLSMLLQDASSSLEGAERSTNEEIVQALSLQSIAASLLVLAEIEHKKSKKS